MEQIGERSFPRVRVGIGRSERKETLTGHVLKKFSREDHERLRPVINSAADAVECIVSDGVDAAMNQFNAGQN
jgi:PTH1 family peptidyl-tRNA hydrolase